MWSAGSYGFGKFYLFTDLLVLPYIALLHNLGYSSCVFLNKGNLFLSFFASVIFSIPDRLKCLQD